MSSAPVLVYLEPDDEVTTVARRVRGADGERVVLVAPGRSRATSSVVALRLLANVADEAGVRIEVVGDALTRSLASEAGLATYASVDDARNALPAAPAEAGARQASIHVVRGERAADETAAVAAVAEPAPLAPPEEATQVRPLAVASRPVTAARRRRAIPLAAILAVLAAILIGGAVLAAVALPAATIVLTPSTHPIGPVEYEIDVPEADRVSGTVEATATVTATGTYPIQVAASGTVVLFNWTAAPVAVPAGTFVASGDQAFATQADVVVPRGTLTSQGTIAAGDIAVAVVAAAAGPAANVEAGAIDTVVNQDVDQRLRGFPENPERRVTNPEGTAGGLDTTGPEILQVDVDAAIAATRAELDGLLADELGSTGGAVTADAAGAVEPTFEGLDGLVGTRDQPEAEVSGTLAYDRLSAERGEVVERAEERLAADETALLPEHDLLQDATRVTIGEARAEDDGLLVAVTVTGASAPRLDRDDVLARVSGRSAEDAEGALSELGGATVDLWPGWVATVPELDWRIDLVIEGAPAVASPSVSP